MGKSRLVIAVLLSAAVWVQGQTKQSSPKQSGDDKALYVVTHIDVYPNFAADTAALLKEFSSDSMKDAGAVRFEVLRDVAHLTAPHSKPFRDKLQPWLGSPFDERLSYLAP